MLKSLPAQISAITAAVGPVRTSRNSRFLVFFSVTVVVLVLLFTLIFHLIMESEGQKFSWISGLYWTLVTMSTLGFGDITFKSDLGRFFSVIVLLSGMILLLVLLPFTFIEFFYAPFMKAQQEGRAPRRVSPRLTGHVILTHYDAVTASFIHQIEKQKISYVLVVDNVEDALLLHDAGINVVVANLDDPTSFERCGVDRALMIAATGDDFANASIVFTAREYAPKAAIVATANTVDSVDVMQLAGASYVMQLADQLGAALARRIVATDAQVHLIGSFDQLRIGESMVAGTPLEGKTLGESRLRELSGVNVIGLWQRGVLQPPTPSMKLTKETLVLLAGTEEQMEVYNAFFCIYRRSHAPCVIIGGGRVGRAVAANLRQMDLDYRIIDKNPERVANDENYVLGSAADQSVLERAGIKEAPAVLITTREDDVNIYLTIYCRKLRPDVQILARTNAEANVPRLHRAGADVVMSYASMGANILGNLLRSEDTLLVAEGLNVFRIPISTKLVGKAIRDSDVRNQTGCSIVAINREGTMQINPPPTLQLKADDELILIGTREAEAEYLKRYS